MKKKEKKEKNTSSISKKITKLAIAPLATLVIFSSLASSVLLGSNRKNAMIDLLALASYAIQKETATMSAANTKMETVEGLLADFKEQNGIDITIFSYETRVFSTVPDAVGTAMDPDILEAIKDGDTYFSKKANVNGQKYYAYYSPVMENGKYVGAFFAGQPAAEVDSMIFKNMVNMFLLGIFSGAFMSISSFIMSKKIGEKLGRLQMTIEPLTKFDLATLSVKYETTSDEVEVINNDAIDFVDKLRSLLGKVKGACASLGDIASDLNKFSEDATTGSQEIGVAIEEVAKGAVSQAHSTNDASALMDDMANQLEFIKEDTGELHETASSMEKAKDDAVSALVSLREINATVTNDVAFTKKQVDATSTSVHKIRKAVEMIQDIADQTKLLSLNASIEAARVGEHGRGFAVVAEEIGKLASQSATSSNEIEDILSELSKNYEMIVQNVENVDSNMATQNQKLADTEEVFTGLEKDINTTTEKIINIHGMLDELMVGVKRIVDVVCDLSALSEENSAGAEETTANLATLGEIIEKVYEKALLVDSCASDLMTEMSVFKVE